MAGNSKPVTSELETLLNTMRAQGASDLHLRSGAPPVVRVDGALKTEASASLDELMLEQMLERAMPDDVRRAFASGEEVDFAVSSVAGERFRVNAFRERSGAAASFRAIASRPPTMDALGLPDVLIRMCALPSGILLVTGATGSGKSTTLAAMINEINRTRPVHILTLEDPIEYLHESTRALVTQRQIGRDSKSFAQALRAALREDPDVILVGELRDLETISLALTAAETGHLVLGSLHAASAAKTVDRIIDAAPAQAKNEIRSILSESLRAVVSQVLLPGCEGGRIAALEVLVVTRAIANLIREDRVAQIYSAMQSGAAHGMNTLDQALKNLVRERRVDLEVARSAARFPESFSM